MASPIQCREHNIIHQDSKLLAPLKYVVVKLFSSWQAEIMGTENVALPKWPINAFLQDLFNFLHFSTLFPALFKKISASVDLQIMKILEMVSAFCTYFQTPGLLTLAASRGPNPRLLSIQKLQFSHWILTSKDC